MDEKPCSIGTWDPLLRFKAIIIKTLRRFKTINKYEVIHGYTWFIEYELVIAKFVSSYAFFMLAKCVPRIVYTIVYTGNFSFI